MCKNKPGDNIAPLKWNKIILVETGEGFISREEHTRNCCKPYGFYGGKDYKVEQHLFETSDTSLVQLVQSMMEKPKRSNA